MVGVRWELGGGCAGVRGLRGGWSGGASFARLLVCPFTLAGVFLVRGFHMKKVFLLLMCMGLASLTMGERVWAYSSLFPPSSLDSYEVIDRSDKSNLGLDSTDIDDVYFGYTGKDYSGYYIGTIIGNDANQDFTPFLNIINYYLADESFISFNHLKVDYKNKNQGYAVSEDKNITLTVTFDVFKDEYEPISGKWSLNNSYGFGFYAVKGGNEFALYFVDPAKSSGIWTTRHLTNGNGNNHPAISHLSGAPTLVHAPEPSSLLLLGGGLLGLGYVVRRRGK